MAGICPSLSHHDGLDEVGGGGHTDWECLWARVCVLSLSDSQMYSQSVSQSENCNASCGLLRLWRRQEADSRVLPLHVCVCVGGGFVEIKMQQILVYEG